MYKDGYGGFNLKFRDGMPYIVGFVIIFIICLPFFLPWKKNGVAAAQSIQAGQPVASLPPTKSLVETRGEVKAQVIRVMRGPDGVPEGEMILFNYHDDQLDTWYHCRVWNDNIECSSLGGQISQKDLKY